MSHTTYSLLIIFLLLSGCASLPDNSKRTESFAITDTHETIPGRGVQASRDSGETQDGFILLGKGLDASVARVALAEIEEKSLDVMKRVMNRYYDMVMKMKKPLLLMSTLTLVSGGDWV